MDETTKKMRDYVYGSVEYMMADERSHWQAGSIGEGTMSLYVLFKMLDMLDSIDSRLIGVENAVSNVEEAISNLNRGHI